MQDIRFELNKNTYFLSSVSMLLILFMLLLSSNSHALALGEMKVHSNLGEKLNATIEVLYTEDLYVAGEETLIAEIASFEKHVEFGIEKNYNLTGIVVSTLVTSDDKATIFLTSKKPIKDSSLSFVLDVEWSSGQIFKDYNLLLDPKIPNFRAVEKTEDKVDAN